MVKKRRPLVPRHPLAAFHDVVTLQGGDGDESHVVYLQSLRELAILVAPTPEDVQIVVHQIHLVDGHQQMRNFQQ